MISKAELTRRLNLPLDEKIFHFVSVFVEFFLFYHGNVSLLWSAGKDSDVGCDIIDKLFAGEFTGKFITKDTWLLLTSYPKPKRVFCNTGLEFPELVERANERHLKYNDVVFLKPKMGFLRVINEIGVAVGSKKIASALSRLKKYNANPSPKNEATRKLYATGVKKNGSISKHYKISERWLKLLNAPFLVSDQCCNIFKKEPYAEYQKITGFKPVVFTTTEESGQRTMGYLSTGCNSFERGKEKCRPYSIFTVKDTWEYAERYSLTFAPVYYKRTVQVEQLDGTKKLCTLDPETRTGCMWCGFGVHLEPKNKNNRIQRLAISHPKYYEIIINKGGLGKVFDYCNIPFKPIINVIQSKLDI